MKKMILRRENLIDAMVLVLAIAPILLVPTLPLQDLPNHVARQYIIQNLQHDTVLREFYTTSWALIPNLGLEMVHLLLGPVIGTVAAARWFCVLVMSTIFLGTRGINRQVAGPGAFAYRLAPLFFYCGPFQFGFLSFCLGIGVSLLAFGLYLRLRGSRNLIRVPTMAAASMLVLLVHLVSFLVYALVLCGFALAVGLRQSRDDGWRGRFHAFVVGQADVLAIIAPPLILLRLAQPIGANEGGFIRWASPNDKLDALAALTTYAAPWVEIPMLVMTLAGAAIAFRQGWVRLDPRGTGVLLLLCLAFLVAPRGGFGGALLDYRLPSAAIFFVLAFIVPGRTTASHMSVLYTWFGALIVLRTTSIAVLWMTWQPILTEFDTAFARIPRGARLEVIVGTRTSSLERRSPPLHHIAARAVTLRQAFEPDLFADLTGHVLHLTPKYRPFRRGMLRERLDTIDPIYSHLLVIYPDTAQISRDLSLTPLFTGHSFILFAVLRVPDQP